MKIKINLFEIKTFNNKSQGCTFKNNNNIFKVYDLKINIYVVNYSKNFKNLEIMFVYEDCVVFKKDEVVIKLSKVSGPLNTLKVKSKINCYKKNNRWKLISELLE